MLWVTVVWSMIAAVCLTFAVICGLVWSRHRSVRAHLLFSVTHMAGDLLRTSALVEQLRASEAALRESEARARRALEAGKHAEQEAQILRAEITHAGRVSMMGQLASGLAHEINQPLAAILRNAEAAELYMQHPSPDLDEIRAILADIRADDERAAQIIQRMRSLLKRRTLETRRLDVRSLVDEVAALVRVDAAARDVKLELDVPGDVPDVRGDRVHIQQVLLNLVFNGMDALHGARLEHRRVGVTARAHATSGARILEIGVDDAGPGIPTDRLAHIFDPFFTTKPNGMGMGLSISRTIVEAHGGRIWAENKSGGGAAFRFTLPIAEEEAVAS